MLCFYMIDAKIFLLKVHFDDKLSNVNCGAAHIRGMTELTKAIKNFQRKMCYAKNVVVRQHKQILVQRDMNI